jgi:hypothetical protein
VNRLRFPETEQAPFHEQNHSDWLLIVLLTGTTLVAGFVSPARVCAQTIAPNRTFQILVFNYTEASSESLVVAEREAGRILNESGFRVTWLNCPVTPGGSETCRKEVAASDIRVRIVPLPVQAKSMFHDSVFGFAIAPAFASVYYQSAQRLAKLDNAEFEIPVILGCVIAHEIGHLLLGPGSHSPSGIMQPQWERKQVQQAMTGRLLFTAEQSQVIRAQAQSRLEMQLGPLAEIKQ